MCDVSWFDTYTLAFWCFCHDLTFVLAGATWFYSLIDSERWGYTGWWDFLSGLQFSSFPSLFSLSFTFGLFFLYITACHLDLEPVDIEHYLTSYRISVSDFTLAEFEIETCYDCNIEDLLNT